ncbi:MAG: type II toxin-antitoxin system HicA family toxin [Microcystaceae cyanobacterium]
MPKLPILSGDKVVKVLNHLGFYVSRQTGSHIVLKKPTTDGEIVCVVPRHRELKVGTLKGVLKQAQVSPTEFINHL